MTESIHLEADLARDLTFEDVGSTLEGWTVVHREDLYKTRWSQASRVVIRNADGQHYAATYQTGLTESQDYDSFDNCDTYEFTPVVARTRMVEVTEYVAPEATDA